MLSWAKIGSILFTWSATKTRATRLHVSIIGLSPFSYIFPFFWSVPIIWENFELSVVFYTSYSFFPQLEAHFPSLHDWDNQVCTFFVIFLFESFFLPSRSRHKQTPPKSSVFFSYKIQVLAASRDEEWTACFVITFLWSHNFIWDLYLRNSVLDDLFVSSSADQFRNSASIRQHVEDFQPCRLAELLFPDDSLVCNMFSYCSRNHEADASSRVKVGVSTQNV